MTYPSKEQVQEATKYQLAVWSRFLPSPGSNYIGKPLFDEKLAEESEILNLILTRFKELGGWTADLSKWVGW